jgi:hypothetical protein
MDHMFISKIKVQIEYTEFYEEIFSSSENSAVILNYVSSGNFVLMYVISGRLGTAARWLTFMQLATHLSILNIRKTANI